MSRPGQAEEGAPAFDDLGDDVDVSDVDNDVEESDEDEGSDVPALRADGKPFTQADLRRMQDSLKKARKSARELAAGKSGDGTADEKKTSDPDAEATALAKAEAKYKPVVVRQAAKAAFTEAGLILPKGRSSEALSRALKLLDMAELDLTDDGEVEGLEDQIEDLKAEYPMLFASTRRPGRIDGADRDGAAARRPKSSADKIAALFG